MNRERQRERKGDVSYPPIKDRQLMSVITVTACCRDPTHYGITSSNFVTGSAAFGSLRLTGSRPRPPQLAWRAALPFPVQNTPLSPPLPLPYSTFFSLAGLAWPRVVIGSNSPTASINMKQQHKKRAAFTSAERGWGPVGVAGGGVTRPRCAAEDLRREGRL